MARYIDADKALEYIRETNANYHWLLTQYNASWIYDFIESQPTADVVPKSEEGAECPTCHGTGRIGTTDWLTKNISKKQLAEEKAQAIAEHEQHIKAEVARAIFAEIDGYINRNLSLLAGTIESSEIRFGFMTLLRVQDYLAELKKKYIGEQNDDTE